MAVHCRQSGDGIPTEEHIIDASAHPDLGGDDFALLLRKAAGAAEKGWRVRWTGDRRFIARKRRWGATDVTREFWAD